MDILINMSKVVTSESELGMQEVYKWALARENIWYHYSKRTLAKNEMKFGMAGLEHLLPSYMH